MGEAIGRGLGYAIIQTGTWWIAIIIGVVVAAACLIYRHVKEKYSAENRTYRKIDEELEELRSNKIPKISFTDSFKCQSCGGMNKVTVPGPRYTCHFCGARLDEVYKRIQEMTLDAQTEYEQNVKNLQKLREDTTARFEKDRELRLEEEKIRSAKAAARYRTIRWIIALVVILLIIGFIMNLFGAFNSLRSSIHSAIFNR